MSNLSRITWLQRYYHCLRVNDITSIDLNTYSCKVVWVNAILMIYTWHYTGYKHFCYHYKDR